MLDPDNQAETIVWGENTSFICTNKKDNTYNYCYNSDMAYFSETKV